MSMYKSLNDIVKVLRNDEQLLRLLFYPSQDIQKKILDPLDSNLVNILDKDSRELWKIRDQHILLIPKSSDLEEDKICRIYLFAGRRTPTTNYLIADQELVIDIFCHSDFENVDLRSTRISDRLNELLVAENITGIGKMSYYNGGQLGAPNYYVGYRHVFRFGSFAK